MGRKYYLIDTENVGDRWLGMPKKIRRKDRIITFYTKYHSRRLEKFMVNQVHNPKILWLECTAGTNALDYQLMGVLSYLIAKHPKASFCIFSNDRDYQDTIDFWKSRGIKIRQKGFKIIKRKKAKKKKARTKKNKDKKLLLDTFLSNVTVGQEKLTEEQYVTGIAKSVSVSDLGGWYQSLTALLGQERGRKWYLQIREDASMRAALSKYYSSEEEFRGIHLIALALNSHDLDTAKAEDAYKIIRAHNRKNQIAIKADFDKKFGKKPSQRYYKVLRPLVQIIKKKRR